MTVYVDPDELKASLTLDGTTYADTDVEQAVAAASGQVERMLNRDFGQTDDDVVRYYTARAPHRLVVHDLISVASIQTDDDYDGVFETTWTTNDYVLEPFNAVTDDEPYTEITVPRYGERDFPTNVKRGVKITGTWGWPTPPQQVLAVAGVIAAQLVKRKRDAPFGFVIGPEAAAYISRSDPTIQGQLNDLWRPKLKAE